MASISSSPSFLDVSVRGMSIKQWHQVSYLLELATLCASSQLATVCNPRSGCRPLGLSQDGEVSILQQASTERAQASTLHGLR